MSRSSGSWAALGTGAQMLSSSAIVASNDSLGEEEERSGMYRSKMAGCWLGRCRYHVGIKFKSRWVPILE